MALAHAAGIYSFVTGGIGGVHRDGEVSMDVSADLTELSRTPVLVVSAGIKSILDIPRTLEVLETNSVPTVAYQTDEFPCFFSPNSGVMAPYRMDSAEEVASAFLAARDLQLSSGMLVAVPPPNSAGESIEHAIQEALAESNRLGLQGQAVTPFILKYVAEKTGGDSLRCNISLVQNNAKIGTDIAIAIAEHKNATAVGFVPPNVVPPGVVPPGVVPPSVVPPSVIPPSVVPPRQAPQPSRIIVMGGTVLDVVAKPKAEKLILGTSNPADCTESDGGVGRNVAEVLGRLGSKPLLYSAVGGDARGQALRDRQVDYGIQDSNLTISVEKEYNTATYLAVLEGKTNDLHTACADMDVMSEIRRPPDEILAQADILVLDANPPLEVLVEAAQVASNMGVDVVFEPTSVPKAQLAAHDPVFLSCLYGAFPNLDELIAMRDAAYGIRHATKTVDLGLDGIQVIAARLLCCMSPAAGAYLVVTLGSEGVLLASRLEKDTSEYQFRHFPVKEKVDVQNCTGAGDSLCGAFLHALLQGKTPEDAVSIGMMAASLSLRSSDQTISSELSHLEMR